MITGRLLEDMKRDYPSLYTKYREEIAKAVRGTKCGSCANTGAITRKYALLYSNYKKAKK